MYLEILMAADFQVGSRMICGMIPAFGQTAAGQTTKEEKSKSLRIVKINQGKECFVANSLHLDLASRHSQVSTPLRTHWYK